MTKSTTKSINSSDSIHPKISENTTQIYVKDEQHQWSLISTLTINSDDAINIHTLGNEREVVGTFTSFFSETLDTATATVLPFSDEDILGRTWLSLASCSTFLL